MFLLLDDKILILELTATTMRFTALRFVTIVSACHVPVRLIETIPCKSDLAMSSWRHYDIDKAEFHDLSAWRHA